jgi:hypothetical protein
MFTLLYAFWVSGAVRPVFSTLWFGGDVSLHAKILQQNPSALNDLLPHDMKSHALKKWSP